MPCLARSQSTSQRAMAWAPAWADSRSLRQFWFRSTPQPHVLTRLCTLQRVPARGVFLSRTSWSGNADLVRRDFQANHGRSGALYLCFRRANTRRARLTYRRRTPKTHTMMEVARFAPGLGTRSLGKCRPIVTDR